LLNLGYALLLYKKFGLDKVAIYLLIGLTLSFITLTIPVQFSGNNITMFWAVEAVLLMWLAQKSQIKSYRFAAVLVQLLMLGSLLMDWIVYIETDAKLAIVANPIFIGGMFVVASFVSVSYLLRNEIEKLHQFGFTFNPKHYKNFSSILALIIGYLVGLFEVAYQSLTYFSFNSFLAISVLYHLLFTAILCFILYRNRTAAKDKIINTIASLNIVGFTVLFARIPFFELEENIINGTHIRIAYYLHMLSIELLVYFWYLIYISNKTQKVFPVFNMNWTLWFSVFILVVLSSTEVILQGLQFINFSIDQGQIMDPYGTLSDMIYSSKYKIVKTGLPVLWGILSFILLLLGIKKQVKTLRVIALSLLGLTILKLFAYDISNVSETGKIIAFILLGVLILIISFVYQKIKLLVIEEDKPPKDDKID
ncbi:MAG: DUF2339 domain-containing protein, partial [Xanthomarina sp.]